MKIKTKLLLSFLIIVIITSVSSLFFLHRVKPITQSIKALDHQLDMVQRISTLKDTISSHTNAVQTYLLTRNRKWESTYHELSRVEDEIIKDIQLNDTTTERKESMDRIIDLNDKIHETELLLLNNAKDGRLENIPQLFDEIYEVSQNQIFSLIEELLQKESDEFQAVVAQTEREFNILQKATIAGILGSIILTLILSLFLGSLLLKPIRELLVTTRRFSEGNMASRVDVHTWDEIGILGNAFNQMAENIDQYIHQRDKAEEELNRHRLKLEEIVAERTRELKETNKILEAEIVERNLSEKERTRLFDQLQITQRMEAIGTLAGGIAHDFNNILASIMGYTELAMEEVEEKSQAHHDLGQIFKACSRAKDLIYQILMFSQQTEQERVPVKVSHAVKEVLKLLRASLPSTIDIRQVISKNLNHILADPTQIHQIVMNLCANAAHAMQENGGVLEVRLYQVTLNAGFANQYPDMKQGQYVKMSFKDTGHGIPPEVRDSIFNPYFTTKEKGEGTGLGLAVVHGIVKNLEGEITVDSEPGKGSIFDVYLPVIEDEEQEIIKLIEPLHTGHENVLVVDDEPGIVEMGGRMLESLGYRVTTRTSSIEALELFKHEPGRFELIITDMTMPNMTGDRFSQEVMKIRPDIPIILCTGYSHQISEEKAKKIGIKAFVMKPLVKRELSSIVRQVLDKEQS